MTNDPAELAAAVRALALRARRALNGERPDPDELSAVVAHAARLQGRLPGRPHGDLARWLDAVRRKAAAGLSGSGGGPPAVAPAARGRRRAAGTMNGGRSC